MILLFAGCEKTPPPESPSLAPEQGLVSFAEPVTADHADGSETLPEGEYAKPVQVDLPLDADFLDDAIFLASGDRVETYANGTRSDFALCPAEKLAVSGDVIAVWGGGVYREFSKDGAELLSYPMEETVDCLCVTELYAVFAVPKDSGHRLVRMERKNGNTDEIPETVQSYGDGFVVNLRLGGKPKFSIVKTISICYNGQNRQSARLPFISNLT